MTSFARKVTTALLALVVTGAGAIATTPGSATAGPAPTAPTDLVAAQARLVGQATAISAVAKDLDGYAGLSAMPERGQVWLYWKGQVPADVARTVEANGAKVVPAAYSERELLAAMARVTSAGDLRVTEIGPQPDGSGLSVSVSASATGISGISALDRAGVRLFVTPNVQPMLLASRQIDGSPHKSGATFLWDDAGLTFRCTTGIPVLHNGVRKILTAGHCGSDGLTIKRGDNVAWGTVEGDNNGRDTMLIRGTGRNAIAASIYEGPAASNSVKPISFPALDSFLDTLVCTSGAKTGEHCKIRIKQKNMTIAVQGLDGVVYNVFPMVKAEQDNHTVAVGQGDSGGPVVAMDALGPAPFFPGDFFNVYPMGTITAIDGNTSVACGVVDGGPTTCAWRMFYAGILDSLAFYGATALTS